MRVPIPWGRKRDGKRSECPKGNNMPAASERARAMDEGGREGGEHNIRASRLFPSS